MIVRTAMLVLALASAAAAEGIEWSEGLEQARRQAARDGRPLLLYFTFDT